MSEKLNDPTASKRKKDHIELAFRSMISKNEMDHRFYYEPLLAGHPGNDYEIGLQFLGKEFEAPIWVSSMTGGTSLAKTINHNLARACGEFKLGMGLGSCRMLLDNDQHLKDFAVRKLIGDQPLYANLGIAQVEQIIEENAVFKIKSLLEKLEADGLIIHINPLQEWLQPEGDSIKYAPLQTIIRLMEKMDIKLIVKEVGQGMGRKSLSYLMQLPLQAIEFAAHGGTNFSKLELLRSEEEKKQLYEQLCLVGHTANEMVFFCNDLLSSLGNKIQCKQFIISGGVRNFLDGYYLRQKLEATSVYGQASGFLAHARNSYEELQTYIRSQIGGYKLAKALLTLRK